MTRNEAKIMLTAIIESDSSAGKRMPPPIVHVVNQYVESCKKDPNLHWGNLQRDFNTKMGNISRAFERSLRLKVKDELLKVKAEKANRSEEKMYLMSDAAKLLRCTTQNLNAFVRKFNIEVIQESERKRYLTTSQLRYIDTHPKRRTSNQLPRDF